MTATKSTRVEDPRVATARATLAEIEELKDAADAGDPAARARFHSDDVWTRHGRLRLDVAMLLAYIDETARGSSDRCDDRDPRR